MGLYRAWAVDLDGWGVQVRVRGTLLLLFQLVC
jgi:hypothetical protein